MTGKTFIALGAALGFIGVAMGAFGAHALSGRLTDKALAVYATAAQYEMYHALALVALGVWMGSVTSKQFALAKLAGLAFTVGTLLFSGSLYALTLSGVRALGAITPFGGVLFLVGWALFAAAALRA